MPDRLLPDRPEIDRAARHPSSGRPLREPSTVNCGPAAAPTGPPGNESHFSGTNEGSQVHHQDSQWTEGATGDPLILVRPSILLFESLASGRDEARYARGLAMPNPLRSDRPKGLSQTPQSAEVRHPDASWCIDKLAVLVRCQGSARHRPFTPETRRARGTLRERLLTCPATR